MDNVVTATVTVFGAVVFLSVVLERLVELLVKPVLPEQVQPAVPYISAGLGLLFAFGFNVDLIGPILATFDVIPATTWAGTAVTGLLLGGGSNLIHDVWPSGS